MPDPGKSIKETADVVLRHRKNDGSECEWMVALWECKAYRDHIILPKGYFPLPPPYPSVTAQ